MSSAGPELPPHLLAKRKRQAQEHDDAESGRPSGAKRTKTPPVAEKQPRVIGPTAPPAPLDERPSAPASALRRRPEQKLSDGEDSSDDDDDGFGPALPKDPQDEHDAEQEEDHLSSTAAIGAQTQPAFKVQRDEWMMVPPKQDDLSARMDPTKLRARGFNTGKGAKGAASSGGDMGMWTETAEQKRKRLQDEVLGVKATAAEEQTAAVDSRAEKKRVEDRVTAARVEGRRGKSLYEEHQSTHDREKEDDPSKRGFDREKDMGGKGNIGHAQRKELLNHAKGFSSKFAGGSYL